MNESIFTKYPEPAQMKSASASVDLEIMKVNGHFHTPFSFSAFTKIEQVFELAKAENVKVLGINDFYTMDGYDEFTALASKFKVFPMYNIEFMALQKDLQASGVKVNDPNNPGRTYFSGKGIKYPVSFSGKTAKLLGQLQVESNRQTASMVEKLNDFLKELDFDINFTFDDIKARYAKNMVRERHIAKALRQAVVSKFPTESEQQEVWLKIFSGKPAKSALSDIAGLENEIRGNLLKAGGKAFVPEDDKAFLSLDQVIEMIVDAGGIPCYPVLLDNPKGEFTGYESDYEKLYSTLIAKKIYSMELIPGRNKPEILEEFVNFFNDRGFLVLFGTEHNTPQLDPITVLDGNNKDLSPAMQKICYESACVVAAHEYLMAKGEDGYLDSEGVAKTNQREAFISLGNAVIKEILED